MNIEESTFNQIAITLARHFDSMYYVDIETGSYVEIVSARVLVGLNIPSQGEDFFAMSRNGALKVVHPDDLEHILRIHDRETILKTLSESDSYTIGCRLIVNGKITHVRHIDIMCEDRKHIICCMEDVEAEFQEKEEQKENLRSAERQARHDDLTGIRNKKAFCEESGIIDERLKSAGNAQPFGIVICDINDLKLVNDTRGHSFGDEAIQRASRMICEVYKHSPVFRIGGDEFAVILSGKDLEQGELLLEMLRNESIANGRSRSGPVVACGMALYDPGIDSGFSAVFERADTQMYENKKELKSRNALEGFRKMDDLDIPIPDERKRLLDGMFGALYTVAGEGYVYLNDMKYDFSRWSLSLIDDFALRSEYMYHADRIWLDYVHPDDKIAYRGAVDAVLRGNAELRPVCYRARRADGSYVLLTTRGFVLSDSNGEPEYFGGIIIPQ